MCYLSKKLKCTVKDRNEKELKNIKKFQDVSTGKWAQVITLFWEYGMIT